MEQKRVLAIDGRVLVEIIASEVLYSRINGERVWGVRNEVEEG